MRFGVLVAFLVLAGLGCSTPASSRFSPTDASDDGSLDAPIDATACPTLDTSSLEPWTLTLNAALGHVKAACVNDWQLACAGGVTGIAVCGIDTCAVYFYDAKGKLVGIANESANSGKVFCLARAAGFEMPPGNGSGGFACPYVALCTDAGVTDAAAE